MIYGSVCSGIEAATVAWHPLGWKPAFFAEIEKYPSAVLKHHYAGVPNHGDFTTIQRGDYEPIDLLVGGTPCQDFSVAGLRAGMGGERGNLTLEFLRLADRLRPRWLVWENVPGVLSSTSHRAPDPCPPPDPVDVECDGQEVDTADEYDAGESHALNSFVAGLSELGYGWAMRVLDAQYAGVPQRRRRVFVVGYLGDWNRAAAVLFERHSLSGHPAPRREAGKVAPTIPSRSSAGGGLGTDFDCDGGLIQTAYGGNNTSGSIDVATAVRAKGGTGHGDFESETFITHSLRADGFDASEDGTGRGTPLVVAAHTTGAGFWQEGLGTLRGREQDSHENLVAIQNALRGADQNGLGISEDDVMYTLDQGSQHAVAFSCKDHGADALEDVSPTLRAMGHDGSHANAGGQVAVVFESRFVRNGRGAPANVVPPLKAQSVETGKGDASPLVALPGMAVRRLTPRECERLQGFPDDYTKISEITADGPRYKALGNSMAVPCMQWIGERIAMVDGL